MEPTQEQKGEFWERCGFRDDPKIITSYWTHPNDEIGYWALPPIDLNNLFKYAVPRAIKIIMAKDRCSEKLAYIRLFMKWLQIGYNALALFWALREVLND